MGARCSRLANKKCMLPSAVPSFPTCASWVPSSSSKACPSADDCGLARTWLANEEVHHRNYALRALRNNRKVSRMDDVGMETRDVDIAKKFVLRGISFTFGDHSHHSL
jgi:hypothetical protein